MNKSKLIGPADFIRFGLGIFLLVMAYGETGLYTTIILSLGWLNGEGLVFQVRRHRLRMEDENV